MTRASFRDTEHGVVAWAVALMARRRVVSSSAVNVGRGAVRASLGMVGTQTPTIWTSASTVTTSPQRGQGKRPVPRSRAIETATAPPPTASSLPRRSRSHSHAGKAFPASCHRGGARRPIGAQCLEAGYGSRGRGSEGRSNNSAGSPPCCRFGLRRRLSPMHFPRSLLRGKAERSPMDVARTERAPCGALLL